MQGYLEIIFMDLIMQPLFQDKGLMVPYFNLIVDLPDGMYTVKTFHDQPEPIQIFVIGKP